MTGPEHYQAAERIMGTLAKGQRPDGLQAHDAEYLWSAAQIHATLALAAATAEARGLHWEQVLT